MTDRVGKRDCSVLAWMQLCRLANVFTAFADIALGVLLATGTWQPLPRTALLLAASGCLYAAGMVLNDYFDRNIDAVERPRRPIPSGRISPSQARLCGFSLMVAGLFLAGFVGMSALAVAALIAVAVLAYDIALKHTRFGPVAMGTCRALNILLGASVAGQSDWMGDLSQVLTGGHVPLAVGMGGYIAGVTWFARKEAEQSRPLQLGLALLVIDAAFGWLIWSVLTRQQTFLPSMNIALILGCIAVTINRRALMALQDPSPHRVQSTIKIMLLSLVVLDAALALTVTPAIPFAVSILALLIPTLLLARILAVT